MVLIHKMTIHNDIKIHFCFVFVTYFWFSFSLKRMYDNYKNHLISFNSEKENRSTWFFVFGLQQLYKLIIIMHVTALFFFFPFIFGLSQYISRSFYLIVFHCKEKKTWRWLLSSRYHRFYCRRLFTCIHWQRRLNKTLSSK